MPGNGVSGQYGDVKIGSTQVAEVCKWNYNPKCTIHAYASNKTGGAKKKIAGIKDGTGSIEGIYDPASPIMATLDVGTSVTLKLYLTATVFYSVPAIIASLKVDVDIDTGDFVRWSADFEANGVWTNPLSGLRVAGPDGAAPATDSGDLDVRAGSGRRPEPVVAPTGPGLVAAPAGLSAEDVAELVAAQVAMSQDQFLATVATVAGEAAKDAARRASEETLAKLLAALNRRQEAAGV